ncbi:MAG: hypothetical protein ACI8ZM_003805 [Crocinitomix sp.]|jgi:hypothetical protein
MEDLTTKIDRYLTDEMSEKEKQHFELELENNVLLKEELNLQKKTMALLERAAQIDLKEKVAAINQKTPAKFWIKPLMRVAAILIILLIPSYFYLSSKYSDANLYASYSAPYPDRITHMGEAEDVQLNSAMEHYNKEEYSEALVLFENLRKTTPANEDIILYQAVSLMHTDEADKAINLLKETLSASPKNATAFQWQLILAYLANNEGEKAISILTDFLKDNQGYQQENAKALLSDLESFWR